MIQATVKIIEDHFTDNWTFSKVDYDTVNYKTQNSSWIVVMVVPLIAELYCVSGGDKNYYQIHITSYGVGKIESSDLMDKAIAFLKDQNINGIQIKKWQNIANGVLDDGTYFYKLIFECYVIE